MGGHIERVPPDGACGLWALLLLSGALPSNEFHQTRLPLTGKAEGRVCELRKLMRALRAAAVDRLRDPANAAIVASHIGDDEAERFRGGKADGTGKVGGWDGTPNGDRVFTCSPHLWALACHLNCDVCPCVSNPNPNPNPNPTP